MNKNPSAVEINGKKYDAITGQLIDSRPAKSKPTLSPGSIDGFVRMPAITRLKPAKKAVKRHVQNVQRTPQRTRTLMRGIVKSKHSAEKTKPVSRALRRTHDSARQDRARHSGLHRKVRHFGALSSITNRKKTVQAEEGEVITPAFHGNSMALAAPLPSLMSNPSHQKLERLLDYALARADAHKKTLNHKRFGRLKSLNRLPKWLNLALVTILAISVIGFIAWEKVPAVSMKLAATKAHVDSSIPYLPGYSIISPAQVKNGALSIELKAESNPDSTLTVTKRAAVGEYSAEKACPHDKKVQTFQQNGISSFICGDSNKAVGVVNGVVTEIQANGNQPISGSAANSILSEQ